MTIDAIRIPAIRRLVLIALIAVSAAPLLLIYFIEFCGRVAAAAWEVTSEFGKLIMDIAADVRDAW